MPVSQDFERFPAGVDTNNAAEAQQLVEHGVEQFFAEALSLYGIHRLRAPWKRAQVSFVFDRSNKPEWVLAVNDCFARYKVKYPTFATVVFEGKKVAIPLQAADMVAYRALDHESVGGWR